MLTHWIGGKAVRESGDTIPVVNPATEQVSTASRAAARKPRKRLRMPRGGRSRPGRGLRSSSGEMRSVPRSIICGDKGGSCPSPDLRDGQADCAGARRNQRGDRHHCGRFCELVVHFRAGSQMSGANELNFQHRMARGVAACIIPWNFPIAVASRTSFQIFWSATPSYGSRPRRPRYRRGCWLRGSSIICRPASSISSLGAGENVGEPLVTSPQVDLVVFVGSERTGRRIGAQCGKGLKKVILELGGKDPLIVDETVNVKAAARLAAEATFFKCRTNLHLDGAALCGRWYLSNPLSKRW